MRLTNRLQKVQTPIIPVIANWTRQTPGTLSLGQGMVSYPPPDAAMQAISTFGELPEQHLYGSPLGHPPLLDLIRAKLRHENSIDGDRAYQVMVTAGSNMAFLNTIMAISDPGDEIILPMPYYFNQEMAIEMLGCIPAPVANVILNTTEAAIGCILGTAVGDGFGLPGEGLSRRRQIRFYPSLEHYHLLFGKGLCSDDTEHTCMVVQSLLVSGGDEKLFARDFAWRLRWWILGLPAGIGWGTLRAIIKLWLFFPERFQGVFSAGNGPAMRSAIFGVLFADDENKMSAMVRISTRLTHRDPKAECGALAIALAAKYSMLGRDFDLFTSDLQRLTVEHGQASQDLINLVHNIRDSIYQGETTESFAKSLGCAKGVTGYIYHSVPTVLHAWQCYPADYATAIKSIIRCGGDTDTTAAMLGAIIGARVGKPGIPQYWIDNLIEWPRTVTWMETLARNAANTIEQGKPSKALPLSISALVVRNLGFMILVLLHGFRRLLPPY